MQIKRKNKLNKRLLIVIGVFLILISSLVIGFKIFKREEIKVQEQEQIDSFFDEIIIEKQVPQTQTKKEEKQPIQDKYIAVLEIPKIDLKRGLVEPKSWRNNVKYNIQILDKSSMPDVDKGNFILAAHSGNSSVSYFKRLKEMNTSDNVYLYYEGKKLTYKVVTKYDIPKTGKAEIIRNKEKNTLTLISCRTGTNYQIVVVCELIGSEVFNG